MAIAAMHLPAIALDYTWGGSSGAWSDSGRWNLLGVPGGNDRAIIRSGTVFVTAATTVGSLVLDGSATVAGPAELGVSFLEFVRGTMGSVFAPHTPGRTVVFANATFNGSFTQQVDAQHELVLNGQSQWSAGNGAIAGSIFGGVITNAGTGVFRDQGASDSASTRELFRGSASGGGSFVNYGTYIREGNGTTRMHGMVNVGTLRVQSGAAELNDSTTSSGLIVVATAGTLRFNGPGALNLDANITGRVDNANGGLLEFQRGNTSFSAAARFDGMVRIFEGKVDNSGMQALTSLRMDGGGQLTGTGSVTVQSLDFRSGTLGGLSSVYATGNTTVLGESVFDGARNQRVSINHTLTLGGDSRWTAGDGAIGGSVFGGVIVNTASATFRDQGAATGNGYKALRDQQGGYSGGTFVNQGTYVRSGLGGTRLYGFNNTGVLQVNEGVAELRDSFSSSGLIIVATAGTLSFNGWGGAALDANITGRIDNANGGLLVFQRGNNSFSAAARFDGTVRIFDGLVRNSGTQTLTSLLMDGGGQLTGSGSVTTQSLDFRAGTLGGSSRLTAAEVGSTTVTGTSVFDGARTQRVAGGHTLTLQGDSRWTAGDNGAVGSTDFGGVVVNTAGATFRDEGTAQAGFSKALRDQQGSYVGGVFLNQGTYVRGGLGMTLLYGFNNSGTLQVDAGTAQARDAFSNTGRVSVAAGAVLSSGVSSFRNDGTIEGLGVLRSLSLSHVLLNAGTLSPGAAQGIGTLTVDGDLTMTSGATLRIELGSAGVSDRLVVTDQVLWNGMLALVPGAGFAAAEGQSFIVASYAQRLSNSTFNGLSWTGASGITFAVDYGATDITLRVTAVPEPSTWALGLMGLVLVLAAHRKRRNSAHPR